jgi:hypothetical protein
MKLSLTITTMMMSVFGAGSAMAQQQGAGERHAPHERESTSIRRNMNAGTGVGDFPAENNPQPVARAANGDVGSTGSVAERRPDSELRGSSGPAPGEIDMSRPIGAADVARIVRAYEPRFRPCYDRARTAHPTLAGRVNMRFVVGRDGSLTQVEVTGMPEVPEVATCIRTELQSTHFPRPEAGTLPFATGMNFAPPAGAAVPGRGRARGRGHH